MGDQVCRVQYFPGAVIEYYDGNKYLGKDDPVEQVCVQKPAPRPEQSRGAAPKPEPKPSPGLWKTALAYLFYSGKAQGTSGCGDVSEACQEKSPKSAWIVKDPESNYDFNSSNPQTVTYKIYGIANCDWTLDGIEVTANFGSEQKTATLEQGVIIDGHQTLTAVFKHKFTSEIGGEFPVFITGSNGETKELKLYPPRGKDTTTKTQCEYAYNKPSGSISIQSASKTGLITYGSNITVKVSAYDCDGFVSNGDKLSASLEPVANTFLSMKDGGISGNYRIFYKTIKAENLAKPLCATVWDDARSTSTKICTSDFTIVPAPSSSTTQPSAVIGNNLKYAYHVGDTASNITAYSDDPKATFKWTVTRPDGNPANTYTTKTISSYTFSSTGSYYFKLEVTAADGKTTNTDSRTVNVYPKSTTIPSLSIQAPFSATVGTSVSFTVPNPDTTNYDYSFDFNDGTSSVSGTSVSHTFTSVGNYGVVVTAKLKSDPTTIFQAKHNITIVPYATPNVGISGPTSAAANTSVSFSVPNPTTGATYTWDFGDNSSTTTGTSVSHTYTQTGNFQVKLSAIYGGSTNSITHNITIY